MTVEKSDVSPGKPIMVESNQKAIPLVEARKISKVFPVRPGLASVSKHGFVRAVDRVSLAIQHGETLGLVGESGSGKSTFGRLLIRLERPTAGTIHFDGDDITNLRGRKLRQRRRLMQIIFQDPVSSLNPRFTVRETLTEAIRAHRHRLSKQDLDARIAIQLHIVGLSLSELDRYPREFSGGGRQRIAIARALAVEPKFIVADEPISALDLTNQAQIVNLLDELRRELHVSFLLISHNLDVIKHLCGRVAVMYLGQIIELAPTDELFQKPAHPYTRALIAATLSHDPDNKQKPFILTGDPPSPQDPPKGCHFHPRCSYAQNRCKIVEPKTREPTTNHFVKCHFDL
jgi:oligopeptide/dipeptide ABC transporter ATP-binding protein